MTTLVRAHAPTPFCSMPASSRRLRQALSRTVAGAALAAALALMVAAFVSAKTALAQEAETTTAAAAKTGPATTSAQGVIPGKPSHGLSAFGTLKYPADFTHFEYVNPEAPKGGRISMIGPEGRITFDSFNGYILKGDPAQGLGYLFDSLMTRADDEPDAVYALVAESATLAPDRRSVVFKLREAANFADGTPLRADDVVFSFEVLKTKGHPFYQSQLQLIKTAEAVDPLTVRFEFQGDRLRDLPITVATLPIFSKAWYETRDFAETSLEPPLGSGPYEIADFKAGTFVTYRRREDYWGKDLPVNKGRFNFGELKYEYYRDRTAELQNLKNGTFDLREEFTSVDWATAYNVAAVKEKRLLRRVLKDERPSGTQGFFINTRRKKFSDPRVRKALDLAFDFEWTNRNLFYGLYERTTSYFENSDLKATGKPPPAELALLEPHRDKLPAEVFGEPYSPPTTNGSGTDRRLLREASRLLGEAGWKLQNRQLVNSGGQRLTIEFLTFSQSFIRIIEPYVNNLKLLGIDASIRLVDASQYQERLKGFDFDITTQRYALPLTPGIEMKNYWGSRSAAIKGSFNLAGIADPVVDSLIDVMMAAEDREQLNTAARALDRVLRAGHYWIPHWYKAAHHVAHWDKFSWPEVKPKYDRGIIETWWYDAEKAARLKARSG